MLVINWKQNRFKIGGLFSRSRMRLTIAYSLLMFGLFIIIIFLAHQTMEWAVTSEQARELSETVRAVSETESTMIRNGVYIGNDDLGKRERMFFYTYDKSGKLQNFSRAPERIEDDVLEVIKNGDVPVNDVAIYVQKQDEDKPKVLMMTACDVRLVTGEKIGMVYLGKDVSALYKGIKKATYFYGGISFIALLTAIMLGHVVSGRVVANMQQAYIKQRQFAADASHELRTPLSVIMASADLLGNDKSIQSPFLKQVVQDMKDEVKKMSNLVGSLLQLARSDNNAESLDITEFNIIGTMEQLGRKMQPLAEKKHITLKVNGSGEVMYRGDEQKIQQLMLILVDNAIKYTPEGGSVTLSYDGKRLSNLGGIHFSVKDTGIGIAKEDVDKLFERFFRVDKARSRSMGGNGLGLAIAKTIVDAHHGRIGVESELGKGTTFKVTVKNM
ncbi:cell wall metabolism sensor histidine kinase WalK [uncultured Anaerovibrio sp.]|uniref:sensor histidine kinase n=1 Tax=uncultured Anaerovibrio sp. TaxID=361586 RepID=UPI0026142FEB|nr:ATP-binding protein [uncultured Anaerovibrio sp.]